MLRLSRRSQLAKDLDISRVVTGLWQVADMERGGVALDPQQAASELEVYARQGFDTFDMADHYGSAEVITGTLLGRKARASDDALGGMKAFTKWCPTPGLMSAEVVREGVTRALSRLQVERIDLMQFHWWSFEHPSYIDAMLELAKLQKEGLIAHIGLTNFDALHLRVLLNLGIPIVSNQVSFSLLDRRAAGALSSGCLEHDVGLLAYGTLGGGFLSERWLGKSEPEAIADWSKMKYRRFIDAIGGWNALQAVLGAAKVIADKHRVSISNVATRWVLEQSAVKAAIIGARLGESEHRADNLQLFEFALDAADHDLLQGAFAKTQAVPGDCGDEYRRPPFLTASGDLSHHLAAMPKVWEAQAQPGNPNRTRVDSGSQWEPIAGYARATRVGDRILVSGTTATHGSGTLIGAGDAAVQTAYILDKITASLSALGGKLEDVIRTRVYLRDAADCEAVSRVHGQYFGEIRPANTLLQVAGIIGEGYLVEIEAEAVCQS